MAGNGISTILLCLNFLGGSFVEFMVPSFAVLHYLYVRFYDNVFIGKNFFSFYIKLKIQNFQYLKKKFFANAKKHGDHESFRETRIHDVLISYGGEGRGI